MDVQNGFMFFRSYWEAAEMLTSDEEKSQYLLAVCQYAFTGQVPDLKGTPAAMFALTKPNLDVSRARAAAGSKKKQDKKQTENKTESKQNQKCTERIKEEDKGKEKESSNSNDQAFDEFWKLYPKKKSKGQARKVWDRLKPDAQTIAAIMEKLPELIHSDDWKKDGGQYIPYPATWLNAEGWNDEVTKKKVTPKANSFNNFDQRDYDYDELEKMLLRKSMKVET